MRDILATLEMLSRPGLLIRAARLGAESYRRETHLRRVLGLAAPRRSGAALMALMDIEAALAIEPGNTFYRAADAYLLEQNGGARG